MTFESVLEEKVKPIGRWQLFIFFLLVIPLETPFVMIPQMANLGPEAMCTGPLRIPSLTFSEARQMAFALANVSNISEPQKNFECRQFDLAPHHLEIPTNFSFSQKMQLVLLAAKDSAPSFRKCSSGEWTYSPSQRLYQHSLTEDFDLVCDRKDLISFSVVYFFMGWLLGSVVCGPMSDKFGRKRVVVISLPVSGLLLLAIAFVHSFAAFVAIRAILGVITAFGFYASFVLCLELTNHRHRNTFCLIDGMYLYMLGNIIITGLSYWLQNWRWVHAASAVFFLPTVLYQKLLPESPKWLIARGNYEEAVNILRGAILANGNTAERREMASQLSIADVVPRRRRKGPPSRGISFRAMVVAVFGFLKFVVRPAALVRWVPLAFVWCSVGMTFYGGSFYAVRLPGNPYVIAIVASAISIPPKLLQWLLYLKFDRKRPIIALCLISATSWGTAFAVQLLAPKNVASTVLATLAISLLNSVFDMIYIFTPEVFPTLERNMGLGLLAAISRIGCAVGIIVERLESDPGLPLPTMIFSVCLFISTVCVAVVPYHSERKLPDSYDEEKEEEEEELENMVS